MKKLHIVDLNLINAKILSNTGDFIQAGISIEANRVYKIAKQPNMPRASKTLDVEGNIILPGLIDVHVHLRDLNLAYKEDFYTGTCAAAAGGFTTVLDMPNTRPPTKTPKLLKEKIQRAKDLVVVNVGFYASLPEQLKQIDEMRDGAIAFKVFLNHPITDLDINCDEVLLEALKYVKRLNLPVAVHAEEGEVIQKIEECFRKSGKSSPDHYLKAHSIEREVNAVKRILKLVGRTGPHVHFCHISGASSINQIIRVRSDRITCEASPHHLLLTTADLKSRGGTALMTPPLRSRLNTSILWKAVNRGLIDVIASDHAPHALKEKTHKNVWEISPGVPGLETTLPLMLTQVNRGRMSWRRLIHLLATKPSEIFKLNRGSIQAGSVADLVIIDKNKEFKIDASKFHSKAKYSPFDGWRVKGKTIKTFVGGRLVYDSGEIDAAPGSGTILHP